MTFRRFAAQVSAYAAAIGLVAVLSIGGCPVAQQPSTPSNDNQTSDNSSTTPPNNQLPSNRPIPPPPIDEGTDGDGTGGGSGGGGTGGDGSGGGGGGSQPISVAITAPQGFDINILPGGQAFVTYEVFGGNPADGQIGVSLFYDSDGLSNTGDETTVQTGLPPRGTARFTANLNPGIYRMGIRAENTRDATVAYATGRLVIVGPPGIQFIQPNADLRIRPGTAVTVQLVITSLATAINYTVFTDRDGVFNGDEVTAFSGGGLGGTGTILTTGFAPGDHFIGATVSDSTGQTLTQYFRPGGTLRKITIDRAPTVQALAPTGNVLIDPAVTPTIQVRFRAGDPEGAATAAAFRDVDAVFNGNEVVVGSEIQISAPGEQEYVVDVQTASLPFGTFRFGARVSDGVGSPVVSYATGTARVNAPPIVNVTAPASDVFVNSGIGVQISFTVSDPEARLQQNGISVLTARDENLDLIPDGPPAVVANLPNNSTSYVLSTNALLGRYLVGIRATDDVGAQTTRWATGTVNVQNRPPVVVIEDPTDLVAVRPADGEDIFMEFVVGDPEFSLAPQPNGVQVQLVRDDDADGQPDGDPVFTDGTGLRLGRNFYFFDTDVFNDPGILNASGFGRFLLGVRAQDQAGNVATAWVPLVADSIEPVITITQPTGTINVDRAGAFEVRLLVTDTSGSAVRAMLDSNSIPLQHDSNPNDRTEYEFTLISSTPTGNPNETEHILSLDLNASAVPPVPGGEYNLYIVVDDMIGNDRVERIGFYAPQGATNPRDFWKVRVRDRLFGTFDLAQLDAGPPQGVPSYGAVLRGFNINDLAGSSMARVPDVNDDGNDEAMFVSRFGRAHLIQQQDTHGIGEAYMIYGSADRMRGIQTFNAVGQGAITGLIYPGIRPVFWNPQSRNWVGTEGISDFTVIPDMDGDDLPELVFGFPRCESVSLRVQDQEAQPQTDGTRVDLPGMGSLEYSAWNAQTRTWTTNEAQFTRGGVVIVSSHNDIIRDPGVRNRRNSRALDLHEVGQMFASMSAPSLVPYLRPVGAACNPMDPNTHIADGTPCGAPQDACTQGPEEQLPVADNSIPNGRGACCTPCNGCVVLTQAECTQLGGTYNGNRIPCVGTDGGNPPQPRQACRDPQDQDWQEWILRWDVVFNNQPPGGFHMDWTQPPSNGKPLANPAPFPYAPAPFMPPAWFGDRAHDDFCCLEPRDCFWTSAWYDWSGGGAVPFPCTNQTLGTQITNSWLASDGASCVWTGFYGPYTSIRQDAIGARVLGQALDDRFGAAVASEGVWLYTAAPNRTAQVADVPALASAGGNRNAAGVVYQLRVDQRSAAGAPTKAQLWMEPFNVDNNGQPGGAAVWPQIDKELPGRTDDTMPVPHQYIIESMGSTRWDQPANFDPQHPQVCGAIPQVDPGQDFGPPANACRSIPYPVDTAGGTVSESPQQIVGPHANARLRYVKALADANGDGIRDVAIGSTDLQTITFNLPNLTPIASGPAIGGIFVLYTRPTGVPGDYLLERITLDPTNINRLNGVYIKGVAGAKIGRAFDNASDFNGDGVDDVIIGSHESNGGAGRVLILLGSITDTLLSPQGGWTIDEVPAARAVHLIGSGTEAAGYNVTGLGDVDGDGVGDVLISAPNAEGGKGVVYLVYGRTDISADNNTFNLADIGTPALPGAKFIGRTVTGFNYNLGGGELSTQLNPSGPATLIVSDGVSALGDIDGDGLRDYAISAMRARPNNRTDAGEVFVLYGRGQIIENP